MKDNYSISHEIKRRDETPYLDKHVIEAYGLTHNEIEVATVLTHLNAIDGDLILDAGCGGGRYALRLAERCTVVGADFSKGTLKVLAEKSKQAAHLALLVLSDIRFLPLRDNLFDRIVCTEVIQHIPTPEGRTEAAKELRRVMKSTGRMVLLVHSYWRKFVRKRASKEGYGGTGIYRFNFEPEDLAQLVHSAGFSNHSIRGSNNTPGTLLRGLGTAGIRLDMVISRTALSAILGDYLLAICMK